MMDLSHLVQYIFSFILDHSRIILEPLTKLCAPLVAFLAVFIYGRHQWATGGFTSWVSVSLHNVEEKDGVKQLLIRTLRELSVREVMSWHVYGERVLIRAAKEAKDNDPILPISKTDRWIVTNKIRGMLSSISADGFLARELGLPTVSANFIAALVCEKRGKGLRRITIILVRKDLLENPDFLKENHWKHDFDHTKERFETLKIVQQRYAQNPNDFIALEMCAKC